MTRTNRWLLGAGTAGAALAALLLVPGQLAMTADHLDPPLRTDATVTGARPDVAADIADVFAFYDADNGYFAVTFHNLNGIYDRDLLYSLNISTAAPATSTEIPIRWRFGPATNGTGNGISVEGLPGGVGTIVGRVDDLNDPNLTRTVALPSGGSGTIRVFAGVRDDPFFFDLQGFRATRATGTLSFNNTRNFFAGANTVSVVFQIPRGLLGNGPLDVHATTARFGGLL